MRQRRGRRGRPARVRRQPLEGAGGGGDSAGEVADVEGPRLARGGCPRLSGEADLPELQCWSALLRALERAFGWHRRALAGLVQTSMSNSV